MQRYILDLKNVLSLVFHILFPRFRIRDLGFRIPGFRVAPQEQLGTKKVRKAINIFKD